MATTVVKRDGRVVEVDFNRITARIKNLCSAEELKHVNVIMIAQKTIEGIYPNIPTQELDVRSADVCAEYMSSNPWYGVLGGRILASNLQKNLHMVYGVATFSERIEQIAERLPNFLNPEFVQFITDNYEEIDIMMCPERDMDLDYFAFRTLERSYLTKVDNQVIETPQDIWMRVAVNIHYRVDTPDRLARIKETYDLISQKYFIHATPTLFNSGTNYEQCSSCYLLGTHDSITGIFKTISDCGQISKWAGGIGVHVSNIRAAGATIKSTNGQSTGIVPMLKVYNDVARYCNQCFVPETIIYTRDGGKAIKDVQVGDEVLTSDGTYRKVLDVICNEKAEEILVIRPKMSLVPLECTGVHEIYALTGQANPLNYNVIMNRLDKGIAKPGFVEAKTLRKDDFMVYPIPTPIEEDGTDITEDDCRFYGIMIGDGTMHKKKDKNTVECGVTLGYAKDGTAQWLKAYLEAHNIHYWIVTPDTNCTTIKFTWSDKLPITIHDLYDEQHQKIISARFMSLTNTKTLKLIRGLMETDGSVGGELYYTTTSKPLMENIRYLLLRLGISSSGCAKNNIGSVSPYKNIVTRKICYDIRIPKDPLLCGELGIEPSTKFAHFKWNNMIFNRIRSIDTKAYEGEVYDLTIEGNHNYTTNCGLVHNSGRRPGSISVYLEPWHADVFEFLELKLNTGAEELRARDLFLAMWIPDLFMKQVKEKGDWYLMSPDQSPGLQDVYGEEFDKLYWQYVEEGRYMKKVPADKLWEKILVSQIETGVPYICYKDHVNKKSNQINVGVVKSSNLCVAPETKILTSTGWHMIKDLKDQEVDVWNGKEFSKTVVKHTGTNQELLKISFSNGEQLECTPYHKFYIKDEGVMDANMLKKGMNIEPYQMPDGTIISDVLVNNVEVTLRIDDTYCFNEPLEHKGMFNGILTGQCSEITEVSDSRNYAVCNLASIAVNRFLNDDGTYDWDKLHHVAKVATYNLNNIIDYNFYPTPETWKTNSENRPIGIGIQGLADLFYRLKIPFESEEAMKLDADVMETIYHGAMEMTIELAEKHGAYPNFDDSPFSQGKFQFDLWGVTPRRYDWTDLKERAKKTGTRNSLLTALMPTATTSQILGNVEAFEVATSNIYSRKTLAGNFMIINKYLIDDLKALGLWNLEMKNEIINQRGSIQKIDKIPANIKEVYKTAWEVKQRAVIDHAVARGPYVDQSQSMNLFMATPTYDKITSALFYGWEKGLKTGCYYLRSLPAVAPQQFSQEAKKRTEKKEEVMFCSLANPEACVMCSS
jgi:ribonucleotide reductase alpha subunit